MKLRLSNHLEARLREFAGYVYVTTGVELSMAHVIEKAWAEWRSEGAPDLCSESDSRALATCGGTVVTCFPGPVPSSDAVRQVIVWYLDRHPVPEFTEDMCLRLKAETRRLRSESFSMQMKQRRRLEAMRMLERESGSVAEA